MDGSAEMRCLLPLLAALSCVESFLHARGAARPLSPDRGAISLPTPQALRVGRLVLRARQSRTEGEFIVVERDGSDLWRAHMAHSPSHTYRRTLCSSHTRGLWSSNTTQRGALSMCNLPLAAGLFGRRAEPAVEALRKGGVAVLPTETSYTFAASVSSKQGVERILQLKGRSASIRPPHIYIYIYI